MIVELLKLIMLIVTDIWLAISISFLPTFFAVHASLEVWRPRLKHQFVQTGFVVGVGKVHVFVLISSYSCSFALLGLLVVEIIGMVSLGLIH